MEIIPIEKFFESELKIGTIVSAEPIENADKLYKLQVNLGGDEPRQIVSGLRQHYSVGDLVGKQVVVVVNLQPVTLRGVESSGMLLATTDQNGKVLLVKPEGFVPNGAKVG